MRIQKEVTKMVFYFTATGNSLYVAKQFSDTPMSIPLLREQVNDSTTLNLIRKYLKAGVMENGLEKARITGVPQGGSSQTDTKQISGIHVSEKRW